MKLVEKYLLKGFTLEQAQEKVRLVLEKRTLSLKKAWSDPEKRKKTLEKRRLNLVPKLRGKKRGEQAKKNISIGHNYGVTKLKLEDPAKWKAKYEKMKETVKNKSEVEKNRLSQRKSENWKKWWADPTNKRKIEKRNKKLSELGKGRVRSEESKRKQSITNTGKVQSIETKLKRAATRERKILEGKSLGIRCKTFIVEGRYCQGTFEKIYIEQLHKRGEVLPENGKYYSTPFGVYQADFEYSDRIIEIKSPWTYNILYGKTPNIDDHYNSKQLDKLKWIGANIKPIQLLVLDKKGNIQKEEWFK